MTSPDAAMDGLIRGGGTFSEITQYENIHKPNDISSHTLYHVKLSTLFSPRFSLHLNKEKFMLDNVIVCYLKLQGTLTMDHKIDDLTYLVMGDECDGCVASSTTSSTLHKCKIYFRSGPGYETSLASFVPRDGCIYEAMVKPNPREENSFCAYTIREVKDEKHRAEFLERCEIEERYYRSKSIENKKLLISHLPKPATVEEVNKELLERTSKHLLTTTSGGRKQLISGGGDRRPMVKKTKYWH